MPASTLSSGAGRNSRVDARRQQPAAAPARRRCSLAPRPAGGSTMCRMVRARGPWPCGSRQLPPSLTPQAAHYHLGLLRARARAHLVGRPDVVLALDALGVGVLRRVQAALGSAHLALEVRRRLAHDPRERAARASPATPRRRAAAAGRCRRASSRSAAPATRVGRVAGEAAADLIVDAALGHLHEVVSAAESRASLRRACRSAARRAPRRSSSSAFGLRELGRAAEAAVERGRCGPPACVARPIRTASGGSVLAAAGARSWRRQLRPAPRGTARAFSSTVCAAACR